jgi:hypothetical protein
MNKREFGLVKVFFFVVVEKKKVFLLPSRWQSTQQFLVMLKRCLSSSRNTGTYRFRLSRSFF